MVHYIVKDPKGKFIGDSLSNTKWQAVLYFIFNRKCRDLKCFGKNGHEVVKVYINEIKENDKI